MKHYQLIQLENDFRAHIRDAHFRFMQGRRFGEVENKYSLTTDLLDSKLLEKVLLANLGRKLTELVIIPSWITATQFNKLLSNVKILMRNDQQC